MTKYRSQQIAKPSTISDLVNYINKSNASSGSDGTMTQNIPNDRDERREFLKQLHKFRNEMKRDSVKIKNRTFEKQHLIIKSKQDNGMLPYIEIPEVMHTKEHGDLVFRIDKENGTIRILKRMYEWDSDKDDIDDE